MGRRAAGEGSIYKLAAGGYAAMLTIGYVDGKRKRKKFQGRTRKEVADKLAAARRHLDAGQSLLVKHETLGAFITRWMDDVFVPHHRPKSVQDYREAIARISPALRDTPLQKVTGEQIQRLIADMSRAGYAPSTIRTTRTVLRQALAQAVRWHLLTHNPAAEVTLPRIERRPAAVLTPDDARALLAAVRGNRLGVAVQLGVSLGLRRGEVCGLRWDDLDMTTGTLTIRGNLQYVRGTGKVYGRPKSDMGERRFKLPAALLAALRWHQERQRAERAAQGDRWTDSGYVFVSARDGGPLNANTLIAMFKSALAAAGLPPIRFHDLRHSCVSFLIAQGVHVKVISALLGHADIGITMNLYGHLLPGMMDDAAGEVEALLRDETARGNTRGNTLHG